MSLRPFIAVCLFLTLLFAGCSSGSDGFAGSSAFTDGLSDPSSVATAPSPATPVSALGSLVVQLPLINGRAVKVDVRTFRVTLFRNGAIVASQEISRSETLQQQEVRFDSLPSGEYQVEILLLSSSDSILGTYRQVVFVGPGQTETISDPAYQNSIPDFLTTRLVPGGANTSWVASGDFNKDGHIDLVTVSGQASPVADPQGRIYVSLGNGDGTFQPDQLLRVTGSGYGVDVADIDKDGNLDIIVATNADVSLLPGNGDGTFQTLVSLSTGGKSTTIVKAVDINDDQILDIITANSNSNDASVLLGLGGGSFAPAATYPLGANPFDILAVDVNDDNVLDLVGGNAGSDFISVLLGDGDGTFTPGTDMTVGNGPVCILAQDLNDDQHDDLFIANHLEDTVAVLLSNGSGAYSAPVKLVTGTTPVWNLLEDVDEDGFLDLVVANFASNDYSFFPGLGSGQFGAETRITAAANPNMAIAVDFNEDGNLDLAAPDLSRGSVFISLGNGNGTFLENAPVISVGRFPTTLLSGDYNEDGFADLISVNNLDQNISVAAGNGNGDFGTPVNTGVGMPTNDAVQGDFNKDGHLDLIVAGSTQVLFLTGHGDGTFGVPVQLFDSFGLDLATGDLNRDGNIDVVVSRGFSQSEVVVLLGAGDGTFSSSLFSTGTTTTVIGLADFDGDRNLDLATLGNTETVAVHFGTGSGSFASPMFVAFDDPGGFILTVSLQAKDVNADGLADLIVPQGSSDTISVALGQTDRTFSSLRVSEGRNTVGSENISKIFSIDINGDLVPDLVTTYGAFTGAPLPGIAVQLGKGDGFYESPYFFSAGGTTDSVVSADFNRDGAVDLAVSNSFASNISVLLAR